MKKHSILLAILLSGLVVTVEASKGLPDNFNVFWALEHKDQKGLNQWLKSNSDIDQLNDKDESLLIKAVQSNNIFVTKKL